MRMRFGASPGGGFSDVFSAPRYQYGHVGSKRGFPDFVANADAHIFVSNGKLRRIYGISAAARTFAAMISRVNDARMLAGKPPMGFVNPVLYQRSVLTDVVKGSIYACDGSVGYTAGPGWDAVTGMGASYYEQLLEEFMKLP